MGQHKAKRKSLKISEEHCARLQYIAGEKGQTMKKVVEALIDISYRVYQQPGQKKEKME